MEQFRTIVPAVQTENKISYNSILFFTGSCFAENIGSYFLNHKFQTVINPFGVIYNPVSIKNCLEFLLVKKQFSEDDLFLHNSLWASYFHHGSFSCSDKRKCIENINSKIAVSSEFLKNSDYLFITFGSAKVYELIEKKIIVSNCHKLPAGKFNSYILSSEEIISSYSELIKNLNKFNPKLKIVFTISPVRYLNYGVFSNSVSKSTLFIAINELINIHKNIEYFPAYEIMMDDLRDYRFYKEDMVHPNEIAIKYLQQKICEAYTGKTTLHIISEIEAVLKAKNHRPVNIQSEPHQKFLITQIEKIHRIQNKYKNIDMKGELNYFESQMI
jgi:hypothetical protein